MVATVYCGQKYILVQKLNDLHEQMQINITVQSFIKAQENFNNMMIDVNAVISEGINGGTLPENPEQG